MRTKGFCACHDVICSRHFEEDDFANVLYRKLISSDTNLRLKRGARPSLLLSASASTSAEKAVVKSQRDGRAARREVEQLIQDHQSAVQSSRCQR